MRVLASLIGAWIISLATPFSYSNHTLVDGDLSVVVFLPSSLKPDESTFYYSSRFEHGSMIGQIVRKKEGHVLFSSNVWRMPHNSNWPESGFGLASEFGVGDDGAFCFYRCGWNQVNDVTNGVLGYQEAKNGESFLKIGVGELIKGSCPTCDSAEDYKFNSPYNFAKEPTWKIAELGTNAITLEHEAILGKFGYRIVKDTSLIDNVLQVTTTLTNLGSDPFSTAWYSHNFFTCDGNPIGPGYSIDLDLKGDTEPLYEEPATWTWSKEITEFAKVFSSKYAVHVEMERTVDPGARIKTEFVNDETTRGGYWVHACDTTIKASLGFDQKVSMYGYNLYIEHAILSPEPQILINLAPGEATTWSQKLVIQDASKDQKTFTVTSVLGSLYDGSVPLPYLMVLASTTLLALAVLQTRKTQRYRGYNTLPDVTSQP
jgi:hypothetical protein